MTALLCSFSHIKTLAYSNPLISTAWPILSSCRTLLILCSCSFSLLLDLNCPSQTRLCSTFVFEWLSILFSWSSFHSSFNFSLLVYLLIFSLIFSNLSPPNRPNLTILFVFLFILLRSHCVKICPWHYNGQTLNPLFCHLLSLSCSIFSFKTKRRFFFVFLMLFSLFFSLIFLFGRVSILHLLLFNLFFTFICI